MNHEVIRSSFNKTLPISDFLMEEFFETLDKEFPASRAYVAALELTRRRKEIYTAFQNLVNLAGDEQAQRDFLSVLLGQVSLDEPFLGWIRYSVQRTLAQVFEELWTEELDQNWRVFLEKLESIILETASAKTPGSDVATAQPLELAPSISPALDVAEISGLPSELPNSLRDQIREFVQTRFQDLVSQEVRDVFEIEIEKLRAGILKRWAKGPT